MTYIKIGVIILNKKGEVLVLKRNEKDGGFWQTLTGTVEHNENINTAIGREVMEETGIRNGELDEKIIHSFIWHRNGDDMVELVFLLRTEDDKVSLSKEHTRYEWLAIPEAIERVEKDENKIALSKLSSEL